MRYLIVSRLQVRINSLWNKDFSLGQLFLWKSRRVSSLNQNKRSKNQLWVWVTVTYARSVGFVKSSFPDVFDELFFYASLFSPKSVSSSYHQTNTYHAGVLDSPNQISSKWTFNADMWLRNLPKTACATLIPFQMLNHIA